MILDTLRSFFSSGGADPAQEDARPPSTAGSDSATYNWLIVGLGNPGTQYATTAHNAGYCVVDALRTAPFVPVPGVEALIAPALIGRQNVALVRSTTYMNDSGRPVAAVARQYGVPAEKIIVIHDELDLAPGVVRIKQGGSHNGHNGLKSVDAQLGTPGYIRVRVGIGRPPQGTSVIDHVLSPIRYDPTEQVARAAQAVNVIVTKGVAKAQHVIHSPQPVIHVPEGD